MAQAVTTMNTVTIPPPSGALPGGLIAAGSVCAGAAMFGLASPVVLLLVFCAVCAATVLSSLALSAVNASTRQRAAIARIAVRTSMATGAGVIAILLANLSLT